MSNGLCTASSIERSIACPASRVLPHVSTTSRWSNRGVSIHSYVRRVLRGLTKPQAIDGVEPDNLATCNALDFTKLAGDLAEVRSEQAWALDVETGAVRFLGENIGRAYPVLGPNEIAGTEDLHGVRMDSAIVTADLKSGYRPVTAAKDNPQIQFFARVHMMRDPSLDVVEGRVLYLRADGRVHIDPAEFDRYALDCFNDELEEMIARIRETRAQYEATGRVQVSRGPWCDYCAAKLSCPAFITLAREMATTAPDHMAAIVSTITTMTPAQVGEVLFKAQGMKSILEEIIDAGKAMAKLAPSPSRPGYEYREAAPYVKESFVEAKALGLLQSRGATAEEIADCYKQTEIVAVREMKIPDPTKKKRLKKKAA